MAEVLASREIDYLVAEKVMGWTPRGGHPIHETPVFATGHHDTFAPHFSKEIAVAWRVVGRMRDMGFHFLLMRTPETKLCIASFYRGPNDREDSSRTNLEDPLAICRAALAALNVEVPA